MPLILISIAAIANIVAEDCIRPEFQESCIALCNEINDLYNEMHTLCNELKECLLSVYHLCRETVIMAYSLLKADLQ